MQYLFMGHHTSGPLIKSGDEVGIRATRYNMKIVNRLLDQYLVYRRREMDFINGLLERSFIAFFLIAAETGVLSLVLLSTASIAEAIIAVGLSDHLGNFG